MRGTIRWERDTENYRRYVSEVKDPATGKFRVVYFPKAGLPDLPRIIPDVILSDSDHGLQCCERDNDYDGNCAVHSAPGVLRQVQRPPHSDQFDAYKYAVETMHPRREFIRHGTETGRFSSRHEFTPLFAFDLCPVPFGVKPHKEKVYSAAAVRAMVMQLMTRVNVLEKRQNLLFKFANKVIEILKFWNLDKYKPARLRFVFDHKKLRDKKLATDIETNGLAVEGGFRNRLDFVIETED